MRLAPGVQLIGVKNRHPMITAHHPSITLPAPWAHHRTERPRSAAPAIEAAPSLEIKREYAAWRVATAMRTVGMTPARMTKSDWAAIGRIVGETLDATAIQKVYAQFQP